VNWFRQYGLGVHAREWLGLVALVAGIALFKLVTWLLTPERDADESEKDYWGTH
jgi:hypothetical protein